MKINDPTFQRVRASLCDIHGLGKYSLDDYAAHVTSVIHRQRTLRMLEAAKRKRAA